MGYNIVPYGYFTYRHMSDDNLFKFNINTLCKFGIVSTLYPVFTLNTSADKYFVYYYLNYGKEMQKFALIQKQGGSRTYMYLNKLRKLRFIVPLLSEQEKISTTLLLLDKLISLQQRKLELLKEIKKGLLQKMFADKSKFPILRFEGFHNEWEQRKLKNVYQKIGNAFVGTASPYYVDAGHFYLESNNIKNGQINRNHEVFINNSFYQKQSNKLLHTGDLVMVQSGHVGDTAVITGPRIKSIQVK